jgi:hypothetical protein
MTFLELRTSDTHRGYPDRRPNGQPAQARQLCSAFVQAVPVNHDLQLSPSDLACLIWPSTEVRSHR